MEKHKDYHARFGGDEKFALMELEERYRRKQSACQDRNEPPEPLPKWLENWEDTAAKEAEKSRDALAARLAAEKRRAFDAVWNEAGKHWSAHVAERRVYNEGQQMPFEFKLWPEEETFDREQSERRNAGLEPEAIPAKLLDWHDRADEENRRITEILRQQREEELRSSWNDADRRWHSYLLERMKYQEKYCAEISYDYSPEEQKHLERQQRCREAGLPPETPDWMKNWRQKADAERLAALRTEAERKVLERKWEAAWKESDAKWEEYRVKTSAGEKFSSQETAYLNLQKRRRAEHKLPIEAPPWMLNEDKLAERLRNNEIERFKEELGIDPEDAKLPRDSAKRRIYDSKMKTLQGRINAYDKKIISEKLPGWMAERNPSRELKSKILNGFYRKHGYTPGAENGDMSLLDRHRVFEGKRMAEAEYAEYEESLKPKPKIIPVTDEQRIELDEFIEAGYMKSYPKDLSKDQADKMIDDLWVRERENRRQEQLEQERRQREQQAREQRAREQRAQEAKKRSRGMDL